MTPLLSHLLSTCFRYLCTSSCTTYITLHSSKGRKGVRCSFFSFIFDAHSSHRFAANYYAKARQKIEPRGSYHNFCARNRIRIHREHTRVESLLIQSLSLSLQHSLSRPIFPRSLANELVPSSASCNVGTYIHRGLVVTRRRRACCRKTAGKVH